MAFPRVKLVVVGDNTVGKTSLLITYTRNTFPTTYIPTVFESYSDYHTVDGTQVLLEPWDVSAGEADDRLRPLAYPRTDVFILCFSVVDPFSYERVRTKWAPELAHFKPEVPVILVGTKTDLREDAKTVDMMRDCNLVPIQYHQGIAMCKDIGAKLYVECSALLLSGVKTVFEHAMRLALEYPQGRPRHKCRRKCIVV